MFVDVPRPTAFLSGIPSGVPGARTTLEIMRALVLRFKRDPTIRNAALDLVRGCPQKDYLCEITRIHAYVRDKIRYVRDTYKVETVQDPVATLEIEQGDCDDKSTLVAALFEAIGHQTQFVAVGFKPHALAHVYTMVKYRNTWIPAETTEPVKLGWKPRNVQFSMSLLNAEGA